MPRSSAPATPSRPSATPVVPDLALLRRRLLAWYQRSRRDLPWRRTRDPYRIWVSEIMLQQTRVDVVVPYYESFLARFPDIATLAAAPLATVLHAWAGLGYYTRARNLHAAARRIVDKQAGRFPRDAEAIAALPGIGPYTAGAIASIAFDAPTPIVDGNVVRVFARWFAQDGDVQSPAARRRFWEWAAGWADGPTPGDANQSLMELGATICTKASPACRRCPVRASCGARRAGVELLLPRPRLRAAADRVRLETGLVTRGATVLLVRRDSGRLLQDWWELPTCDATRAADGGTRDGTRRAATGVTAPGARLAAALQKRLGIRVGPPLRVADVRHSILHHRIDATLFEATARRPTTTPRRRPIAASPGATPLANLDLDALEVRWVRREECAALPLSTLTRKVLRAAGGRAARREAPES